MRLVPDDIDRIQTSPATALVPGNGRAWSVVAEAISTRTGRIGSVWMIAGCRRLRLGV